ncbi:hypothetical protein PQX77_005677 [Marasmius sp. AFHP31]|nr:hypothetical protein PQX77_005677 [Marasmius sp. AFHP31]
MRYAAVPILALSLSLANAQSEGVRQLQSASPALYERGDQGCISASDNFDGAPVVLHNCNFEDVSKHSWTVTPYISGRHPENSPPATMKIFGDKCLDVKDGINADGAKLQLWTCSPGNTNQLWISRTDNTWNWAGTNKCIDLTDGNINDGNQLQLWTCVDFPGSANQKFSNTDKIPNVRGQATAIRGGSGDPNDGNLCLTATSNTDGAPVVLSLCSTPPGQTPAFPNSNVVWTPALDPVNGPMTTFDGTKCLDLPNGDWTDGNKLQVWSCVEGSGNQRWRLKGASSPKEISWGGSHCLQVTNGNFTEGNTVEIAQCDSTKQSQWWFSL